MCDVVEVTNDDLEGMSDEVIIAEFVDTCIDWINYGNGGDGKLTPENHFKIEFLRNALKAFQTARKKMIPLQEMDGIAFLEMRNWLEGACEAKGAKCTGGGVGFGQADIFIEVKGFRFNVSIEPLGEPEEVRAAFVDDKVEAHEA